jgi:hypothetical protein
MSRSNPTTQTPHPATRWFEVNGQNGEVFFYDKEKKEKVPVSTPFGFILLDETSVIKGWHEPSESGIISNEVRDTRNEVFVVRSFKGGEIASGHYNFIKDKVAASGGSYNANLYIAFKGESGKLEIGSLMLKGAALSAWFDFRKEARKQTVEVDGKKVSALYAKALVIKGWEDGKKGSIKFKKPVFALSEIKPETNLQAIDLDKQLQEYLTEYFRRTKAEAAAAHPPAEGVQADPPVENQEALEPLPEEPEEMAAEEGGDVPF